MSSNQFWLPSEEQKPSLVQKVGDCGFKAIQGQVTWEFSESNFFLGLGGIPETKWLSISPFTVPLQEYNLIEEYGAQFEIPKSTDYFISPPHLRTADVVTFAYPAFYQIPVCSRGTHFGIQVDTQIFNKSRGEWSTMMPEWGEWNTKGITIQLADDNMTTQTHQFKVKAALPDYFVEDLSILMEFEIAL